MEMLAALSEIVPSSSAVLPTPFVSQKTGLAIRHYGLRSVAFLQKDGGAFAYADHAKLVSWENTRHELILANKPSEFKDRFTSLSDFSCEIGAGYILDIKYAVKDDSLVAKPFPDDDFFVPLGLEVVSSNELYSLLQVRNCLTNPNLRISKQKSIVNR